MVGVGGATDVARVNAWGVIGVDTLLEPAPDEAGLLPNAPNRRMFPMAVMLLIMPTMTDWSGPRCSPKAELTCSAVGFTTPNKFVGVLALLLERGLLVRSTSFIG